MAERAQHLRRWFGPLLALVVLLTALGAALPTLTSRLLGADMVDAHGTAWFYWVIDDAIARGQALTRTDRTFWPWGKDLHLHTGTNILDAVVAIPLRRLFGATLGANLLWVGGLLATVWAGRRWLSRVTDDPLVIWPVAAMLALCPPVLLDLSEGRPTQAILLLPVLAVTALWDLRDARGWKAPVAAGLLLALSGYQYWFYGCFLAILAVMHGLVCIVQSDDRPQAVGRQALAFLVTLLCVLPAALPLVSGSFDGTVPGLLDTSLWRWDFQPPITSEGIAVSLLAWQPLHLSTGWMTLHPEGGQVFIPYAQLVTPLAWLLTVLGVIASPHRRRLFVLLVPVSLVAIGPTIALGELAVGNGLVRGLMETLPFFKRLWWPARALSIAAIPAALAIATAVAWLRARHALGGGVLVVVLVASWAGHMHHQALLPVPTWDPTPPAGFRCLADGPEGAVLELPWGQSQRGLAWQSAHGRPLIGGLAEGNASLVPEGTQGLLREDGWMQRLVFLGSDRLAPKGPRGGLQSQPRTAGTQLDALGVAYVVVRRDELGVDRRRDSAMKQLLGEPVYQDARTWIFAPWGAPYPCPHRRITPDTQAVPLFVPPRASVGADSPLAVRLRPASGRAIEATGPAGKKPALDEEPRRGRPKPPLTPEPPKAPVDPRPGQ